MMEEGDCLLIPSKWYHHVHSLPGRNLAVNIWFGSSETDQTNPSSRFKNSDKDKKIQPPPLTPADCAWSEWPEGPQGLPRLKRNRGPCDRTGEFASTRIKHTTQHNAQRLPLLNEEQKYQQHEEDEEEEEERNRRKSLGNNKISPDLDREEGEGEGEGEGEENQTEKERQDETGNQKIGSDNDSHKKKWDSKYFQEPNDADFFEQKPGQTPITFDGSDPTTFPLIKESLYKGLPVVIRNATIGMKMNGWNCQKIASMTKSYNQKAEGGRNNRIDFEIPQIHYSKGMGSSEVNPFEIPHWMYQERQTANRVNPIDTLIKEPLGPTTSPGYWSLKSDSSHQLVKEIRSNIEVPRFMQDWPELETIERNFQNTPELWFGMKRAGAQPHQDSHCTSTISFQLSGRKRWRTGPALEVRNVAGIHGSYDGYIDPNKWQPFFEVILNPGDAIIIPTSFIHETKNIQQLETPTEDICSLSITHQFRAPPPSRYLREYLPRLMLSPSILPCQKMRGTEFYYNYGSMGWVYGLEQMDKKIRFFVNEKKTPVNANEEHELSMELWKLLLMFDFNNDKQITVSEYYLWMKQHSTAARSSRSSSTPENDPTGHVYGIFKYFDVNNNRVLEKTEVVEQFIRWYTIRTYSTVVQSQMNSIRKFQLSFFCYSSRCLCYYKI